MADKVQRSGRRLLLGLVVVLVVVAAAGWGGIGWYYSDEILAAPPPGEHDWPLEVVAVDDDQVTLRGDADDDLQVVGLEWADGYARVGTVTHVAEVVLPTATEAVEEDAAAAITQDVTRTLAPYPDVPEVGDAARLDANAAPLDLAAVTDLDARTIALDGELGPLPTTYVPGSDDRWVVFVHGRGASRAEGYRLLEPLAREGYPILAISYRNDEGAPRDPDGRYGLGWTEAADVATAVDHAMANGAADVVLAGWSMGGAVVGNHLRLTAGEDVGGVIYDSPVLRWREAFQAEARTRDVPTWLTPWAERVVGWRTDIDFSLLDQVDGPLGWDAPVLLVHGDADPSVPVDTSDAFAARLADQVTFWRPPEVGHVRAWNAAPQEYERRVLDFLASLDAD